MLAIFGNCEYLAGTVVPMRENQTEAIELAAPQGFEPR